jgi:hypothetical protein
MKWKREEVIGHVNVSSVRAYNMPFPVIDRNIHAVTLAK